jgi:hypothetical protein
VNISGLRRESGIPNLVVLEELTILELRSNLVDDSMEVSKIDSYALI